MYYKVRIPLSHAMETYEKWRYSSTVLYIDTNKVSDQLYSPAALFPGKESTVPNV
jgi:hypothetical protein